jgi:purine-binding chemotaxis protein CheW
MRKFETIDEIDPADTRRILNERARALARQPEEPDKNDERITVITFTSGTENYAIEAIYVREVARFGDFLPLPGTPDFVVGAAKLRGEMHAILDIGALAGTSHVNPSSASNIIIVGRERFEFGLIADTVHDILTLSRANIVAPAEHGGSGYMHLFRGFTQDATAIIDGAALLDDPTLYIGRNLDLPGEDNHGIRP